MADIDMNRVNEYGNNYNGQNNEEIDERTYLLNQNTANYNKIFLGFLLLLLFVGVGTGGYLLITEDKEWKPQGKYNFISRKDWKAHLPISIISQLQVPAEKVLFLQTNDSSCAGQSQCSELVHKLQFTQIYQLQEPDILYNFIVADEYIYEGRSWKFQSAVADNNTISLAFLGNFNEFSLRPQQINQIKLFLDVAVTLNKLVPCYQILVRSQGRFLFDLASDIHEEMLSECEDVDI